jgi:hypothetical protein
MAGSRRRHYKSDQLFLLEGAVARKLLVYGLGDKSSNGFPKSDDLVKYLEGGIFRDEGGRYRYTQAKSADVIVLAREGLAFGHFEIDEAVAPNEADRKAYPPVRKVYLVRKSVRYEQLVRLSQFGITKYQFGKYIDEAQFSEILTHAGKTYAFPAG